MDQFGAALAKDVNLSGAGFPSNHRHGLEFAFVLVDLQNLPHLLSHRNISDCLGLMARPDAAPALQKDLQIDFIAPKPTLDLLHRVTTGKRTSHQIWGVSHFLEALLLCQENARNDHLWVGQSAGLIKAKGFETAALDCLLAVSAQDVAAVEANQAEGVGEVEVDGVGGRAGHADEVQESEDHHRGFNVAAEQIAESDEVEEEHHKQHFDHEVNKFGEEFGVGAFPGQDLPDDPSPPRTVPRKNDQSQGTLLRRFNPRPFEDPVFGLLTVFCGNQSELGDGDVFSREAGLIDE